MKTEKIATVIGEIAEHHIEEALNYEQNQYTLLSHWKTFQKTAACIALITLSLIGCTGIVLAANKDFRNVVINLFGFTEEEKIQVENGHTTGKLDKTDVLLTFLDELKNKSIGKGVKIKYNDGYEYKFLKDNHEHINVIVVCEPEHYRLLVNMKQESITEGVIGWYVASYEIISSEQADKLIMSFSENPENAEKTEEGQSEEGQSSVNDNVIKADDEQGKIYNALHKEEENIISLTKKETHDMKKIFDRYENDVNEYGDGQLCKFIILFDNSEYMMTEGGSVAGEKGNKAIAFKLTKKDLKKVMSLFHKYKIPD